MTSDITDDRRHRGWCGVVAALAGLLLFAGCGGGDTDDASAGQITVPRGEAIAPPATTTDADGIDDGVEPLDTKIAPSATTTTAAITVALDRSYFGEPAEAAIVSIERLGIFVAAFAVCSGSVREGEVRQITTGDGVILDDVDGLTDAARSIELGAVLQMKVGTGTPCD